MEIIRAKDLTKNYGEVEVLKGIDLSIASGEMVAIVGASGAGNQSALPLSSRDNTHDLMPYSYLFRLVLKSL